MNLELRSPLPWVGSLVNRLLRQSRDCVSLSEAVCRPRAELLSRPLLPLLVLTRREHWAGLALSPPETWAGIKVCLTKDYQRQFRTPLHRDSWHLHLTSTLSVHEETGLLGPYTCSRITRAIVLLPVRGFFWHMPETCVSLIRVLFFFLNLMFTSLGGQLTHNVVFVGVKILHQWSPYTYWFIFVFFTHTLL